MGEARSRSSSRERGAAAVEFALVVPILLALMFGIVDYGLWFGDSLNVRQGVDEAARHAVVKDFGGCGGATPAVQTACVVRERVSPIAGQLYVRVEATSGGPLNWKKGGQLTVCAVIKVSGLTGLTPMPDGGFISAAVSKRIEKTHNTPVPTTADTLPSGATWAELCS